MVPDVGPSEGVEAGRPPDVPLVEPGPPSYQILELPPLAALSLREKAAQLIMPWIPGDYWSLDNVAMSEALRLARDERVGGFVVGLGGSALDLAAKFNALQRAARLPLLMAADLESGPSMRIDGSTAFPGNMAVGASGREDDAWEVGRVVALEGRAVGIQIVFAPVVDVNNNPANPIINVRSYGEDPRRVGLLGAAFTRGLREHGMMSTAKHFPGHGDTGTDTHLALPVIIGNRARIDSIELVPFRAAVAAGVDAVMTAHIAMPGLNGSQEPATMSSFVLDTLLRGEMGFRGLVVTDALDMGAIVQRYGAGLAAVRALQAGADILLMPTEPAAAIDAIVAAVGTGTVSEARLDSSVARVLLAKARAGLFRRRTVPLDSVMSVVGRQAHLQAAAGVAERSIVLVKDQANLVPLSPARRRGVLVVAYGIETRLTVGMTLAATLRAGGAERVRHMRLWPASGPASYDSVRTAAAQASTVIFAVSARPVDRRPEAVNMPDSLSALIRSLSSSGAAVITVALGSPYLLSQVPESPAYLTAWTDTDVAQIAVGRAIMGMAPITGRLPVSLAPWPMGSGIQRTGTPCCSR